MSDPVYLLDTGVLLVLLRGGDQGRQIDERFRLSAAAQKPLVCIVSHAELRVLARRNGWGNRRLGALQAMLDNLVSVDISHPRVIQAYVDIDVASQEHPDGARNMGKNDVWIAAAARASGATLLTLDTGFAHLIPRYVRGVVIPNRLA